MIRLLARLNQSTLAMKHLVLLSKSDMILRRFYISRQLVRFFNQNKIRLPIQTLIIEMVTWCSKEISKLLKLDTGNNENVKREIYLQLYINRRVYTAWFSLLADIQDVAPYIEKPDNYPPTEVAKAYELLDALSTDVKLRRSINLISQNCLPMQTINDKTDINPGILLLARHPFQPEKGIVMNTMDKTVFLRRVKLFEDLPVESLLSIAEIATETDMAKGQIIFKENSVSDRLYFIVSGEITLKKYNFVLTELKEADYFGELGLLDNLPRTADAIAETDGVLLYIEKEEFVNILEDMPVIMRAVTAQIIKYLRQVLEYERKNFVPDR